MKKVFLIFLLMPLAVWATEPSIIASVLVKEFVLLKNKISTLEPEGKVGGLYNFKKFKGYTLLWKLEEDPSESEVIRIYREAKHKGEQAFSVTYHKNDIIVRGQMVLRRFYGPDANGWRNDTVDFDSGEYLGTQGAENPTISEDDKKIMKAWGLTSF